MRSNLPSKPPLRPYITTTCLHLLAERDLCWRRNEKNRYNDLDRLVRRSVARARREFIESQIAERNWKGVKMCKPYQAKPHRIVDLAKKERKTIAREGRSNCGVLCCEAMEHSATTSYAKQATYISSSRSTSRKLRSARTKEGQKSFEKEKVSRD